MAFTRNRMASINNKHKYAKEEEAEVSMVTSKKQRMSGSSSSSTDNLSSSKEVSSEEETIRWAYSDDGDITDSENNSIRNNGHTFDDDGSDKNDGSDNNDGSDDQFSDKAFD
jgi:hypothetical protein